MICPEGYTLASQLRVVTMQYALEEVPIIRGVEDTRSVISEREDMRAEIEARALDTVFACVGCKPYISDGTTVLKVDPDVIFTRVLQGRATRRDYLRNATSRYTFVDMYLWVIDVKGAAAREAKFGFSFGKGPMVAERLATLERYQGWSICFKSGEIPADIKTLKEWITNADDHSPARVGRPSTKADVLEAYARVFPSGHGSLSWKETVRRLEPLLRTPTSPSTLRRALGERDQP